MKKLIFTEGVTGVGKSTTAVKLCDELNSRSYSAVCHLEGDVNNPVDLFSCGVCTAFARRCGIVDRKQMKFRGCRCRRRRFPVFLTSGLPYGNSPL